MTDQHTHNANVIHSINPATLEVNTEIAATPVGDVQALAGAARDAQKKWAALTYRKRLAHILKVRDVIISEIDHITRVITRDNGKTLLESVNTEIYPSLDMVRFLERDAPKALRNEKLSNAIFPLARIESANVFEPLGVVTIIAPWNYPFAIPVTGILPALAVGNTVLFKPASATAWVGDTIKKIFEEAGLPEGVLHVVQGAGAAVGDALMAAGTDKIVFTGSVAVGKQLMAKAAETLTPITLELGGKDPFIVLDDADLDRAAAAAVWGAFVNAGQTCASVERVYVQEDVAGPFIDRVVARTARLRVGNGLEPDTDMGPLISESGLRIVEAHVADAVAKGARVLHGGRRIDTLPGHFYEPTVLVDATHGMDAMRQETFGPTLPIMTFTTIDQAVELANDSRYGLTASVWSRDIALARKVARRIQTGVAVINNCLLTYGFAQCPWGGVKDSGLGRTHGIHGLHEFTSIKNITTQKQLLTEDLWWYPYSTAKYNGMKAMLKAMFCHDVSCRTTGLADALRSFRLIGK